MHSQNQHSGDVSTSHISMNVVEVGAEAEVWVVVWVWGWVWMLADA